MANAILCASGIYAIRNLVNGKFYIGSAVHLQRRRSSHWGALRCGTHKNVKLQRAWRKYGSDAFVFEVLEYVVDVANLIGREQCWIDSQKAVDDGYNILPKAGSCLGRKHSAKTIAKMREAAVGRVIPEHVRALAYARIKGVKQSPEVIAKRVSAIKGYRHSDATKAKISAAHKGKKQAADVVARRAENQRGRTLTSEHRAKLSLAGLGHRHTPETIAKMSRAQIGRVRTAEQRAANAAARLGIHLSEDAKRRIGDANRGKKRTQESKDKMSAARRGIPLTDGHKAKLKANHKGRRGMANRPESVSQMVETKLRLREERFVIAREYFLWIFMMACKRLQPSC